MIVLSIGHLSVNAQQVNPDEASVNAEYRKLAPAAILRADYLFPSKSYLYLETTYNGSEQYSYLTNGYRVAAKFGGEIAATDFWYFGGGLKYQWSYMQNGNALLPHLTITHRGKIGKIGFVKELSGEYVYLPNALFGNERNARASLGVGLFKEYNVFSKKLTIALSYKLTLNTTLGELYNKRKIDFIKTRIDLNYEIIKNTMIGAFFMLDSERYFTLGNFDMNGNQVRPDYRVNRITPVLGLMCNFFIIPKDSDIKFLPGLPFR